MKLVPPPQLDAGLDAMRSGGGVDKMKEVLDAVVQAEVRGETEEELVVQVNRILQR